MSTQETVFVTGGASGIGLAIVEAVLENGWRAMVVDRDERSLAQCREALKASGERVRFVQLDIADEAAVVQAVERCEAEFGPITGLVNSAGIARDQFCLDTGADDFRRILDVNVVGSFVVSREIAKRMRERGRGSIVNIASVSGIRGNVGRVAYGASKGAVIMMTQVMAVELAESGIRVNAVAPGPIETPLVKRSAHRRDPGRMALPGSPKALRQAVGDRQHGGLSARSREGRLRDRADHVRGWRLHGCWPHGPIDAVTADGRNFPAASGLSPPGGNIQQGR